jgi:antitoxin (DNA-binding transcriptional repressor) of toxin-antitoxin stability system
MLVSKLIITSRVERGEEILITKRNKLVAMLSPYRPPLMTPEREKAIQHAIDVMGQGLPWGRILRRFRREEMDPTNRDGELVADSVSKCTRLCKREVMRIRPHAA